MCKVVRRIIKLSLLLALGGGLLSGCGAPPPPKLKVYWPPPPADPKMEWITSFSSEDNFPKGKGERLAERFLGKDTENFLRKPMDVVSNSKGIVYISDMDQGNIWVVDFLKEDMSLLKSDSNIGDVLGLAIDGSDNLYVSDGYSKQVLVFNQSHRLVRGIGKGELKKPTFLAVNKSLGRLYVSDVQAHRIVVFDLTSGEKLFSFGRKGGRAGELYGPQGLAIDSKNNVFVAEQFNARIQAFDADGNHLYMFGSRGDHPYQFEGPRGLAFDSQENLFVAEARKASVLLFRPDGTPLTALGIGGRSVHQLGFTLPNSVYIDSKDRIYISDGMNKRVTIWQELTPEYLAENPIDNEVLKELEERVLQIQRDKESSK